MIKRMEKEYIIIIMEPGKWEIIQMENELELMFHWIKMEALKKNLIN